MSFKSISFSIIALILSTSANSALVSRLGGLAYYDDVANLTWLANANTVGTTMLWTDATIWAENLDVAGITGWRLPDTLQPDPTCSQQGSGISFDSGCSGSELGNLFYNVLGGVAHSSIATNHNSNYDLFSNIQTNDYYWSSTERVAGDDYHWVFNMGDGSQAASYINQERLAWAVHTGDVSAVPVPATVWLFGSGLLGLVGTARCKKHITANGK